MPINYQYVCGTTSLGCSKPKNGIFQPTCYQGEWSSIGLSHSRHEFQLIMFQVKMIHKYKQLGRSLCTGHLPLLPLLRMFSLPGLLTASCKPTNKIIYTLTVTLTLGLLVEHTPVPGYLQEHGNAGSIYIVPNVSFVWRFTVTIMVTPQPHILTTYTTRKRPKSIPLPLKVHILSLLSLICINEQLEKWKPPVTSVG